MKYLSNTFVLYLIILILPVVFFTVYFSIELYHKDMNKRNQAAQRITQIHEEKWKSYKFVALFSIKEL